MTRCLLTLVRGWRVALLLVVVACASPNRASAECGSHVLVLNAPNGDHHAMPVADELPAPLKPPCSGPNCSRTPDHHTPAPFAPVVTPDFTAKAVAHTLGAVALSEGGSSYPEHLLSTEPISRASSVFHPPRIG